MIHTAVTVAKVRDPVIGLRFRFTCHILTKGKKWIAHAIGGSLLVAYDAGLLVTPLKSFPKNVFQVMKKIGLKILLLFFCVKI